MSAGAVELQKNGNVEEDETSLEPRLVDVGQNKST